MDNAPETQPKGNEVPLFFTLTLKAQIHCTNTRSIKESIKDVHNILSPFCRYTLYPECHLTGNIHYHGMLYVFDMVKYYKTAKKLSDLGRWDAQHPRSQQYTRRYIQKDHKVMEEILGIKLPLTETSCNALLMKWVIAAAERRRRAWDTFAANEIDTVYLWNAMKKECMLQADALNVQEWTLTT